MIYMANVNQNKIEMTKIIINLSSVFLYNYDLYKLKICSKTFCQNITKW